MANFIPYPFFHDDVPIDVSFIFEDEKPAGKHGFMKVSGRDFVFEDGTKVKFWGTNFNGCGCFPEHDYAEKLAKRLSKIGINLVRFHQLDSEWHTPNIFSFTKGKRVTDAHLDPESMDRLDYLIYCLKKEGIYCYIDMLTYRKFRSDEDVENAKSLKDAAKPICLFDDKLIKLQKEFCRELWQHKNPYTKLTYCDDPVFVMTEIVNESDMFNKMHYILPEPYESRLRAKLDAWLKENNIDKTTDDIDLYNFEDETLIDFKMYIQEKYYNEMYSYMRECGVKIPITGTNWPSNPANVKNQLVTDFYDSHVYLYDWRWGEFEKHCTNYAITDTYPSYMIGGAYTSAKDKPTFISEWDVPWPNQYRAESPLYSAAYGLLQGWSGFAIHTYSYTVKLERMNKLGEEFSVQKIGNVPYRQGVFSTWNDPAKFGLFYHAAIMTRRGDVSYSNNPAIVKQTNKNEWDREYIDSMFEKSAIMTEIDFGGEKEAKKASRDDVVISDTGELILDRKNNFGLINTPKTKCAYGLLCKNRELDLSDVKIKCDNDFAVIAMSSLTDQAIAKSDNILLTTVGRAENTNSKFIGDLMLDIGKAPVQVEVIKADIEIETQVSGLVVWAISPDGFYIGTVPATYENGKFKFTVGETSQSMYYLIVKE